MKMKSRHYEQLAEWIKAKVAEKPDLFKRAYQKYGLSHKQYRWDLIHSINQSEWIKEALYPYLDDNHIDAALVQIIGGHDD